MQASRSESRLGAAAPYFYDYRRGRGRYAGLLVRLGLVRGDGTSASGAAAPGRRRTRTMAFRQVRRRGMPCRVRWDVDTPQAHVDARGLAPARYRTKALNAPVGVRISFFSLALRRRRPSL
jgi:hypothetical protein